MSLTQASDAQSLYDARSTEYDDSWHPRFARHILELAKPQAGEYVLDLACGWGRHTRYLAHRGWRVLAVDRDAEAIASLAGVPNVNAQVADLEQGPWPYPGARFDAVVVTNYLWRPLLSKLFDALHSFDFAWLRAHRPAWDIVMWVLSIAGLVISVSGVVIGWRRLKAR